MTNTPNIKKLGRQPSHRRPPVEKGRWASKGTKPLPEQQSIKFIIGVIITHLCRKVLFIETRVKITLYSLALFFGSLVFDFVPMPRTYMSSKESIFNVYFMKIGWAWLIFIVGSFVYLTSATYGCGKRNIIQQHMIRLIIGTGMWGLMTKWLFVTLEQATGTCLGKAAIDDKWLCVTSGFQWHSFDVSGHAFLLIYMNLVTVEEKNSRIGWGSRSSGAENGAGSSSAESGSWSSSSGQNKTESDHSSAETPLRSLTNNEFSTFKEHYEVFTPYIRVLFICMTLLSLWCDVLLACTVVYFHTMPQKVVGGACAMAAWYITYRVMFKNQWPGLPGDGGLVRYQGTKEKPKEVSQTKKKPVILTKNNQPVPMFMGMPLYGALKKDEKTPSNKDTPSTDDASPPAAPDAARPSDRPTISSLYRSSKPSNAWR
ncbi:acyl-coenzyme A diphosphatase FITM2 [Hyalella azteca]|uniref:Acyl-coenzyme A diphosphatase FITM2 n=1 Tax=Hyalella azteca TaxID=294128 RepID=A0A8B7PJH2_HYAAZ|nr:acyl-coenzyme A diphosphatase FITM2 [Hyalella azteca]